MNVAEAIKSYGAKVDAYLEELIPRGRQDFLSEPVWHHMDTCGKRIRPALCLLTCEALGGHTDDALPFAAAVELLHNMLLLHDDIEDGDEVRRDQPTVWKRFGVPNAVNAGDYLLARAYAAVLATPVDAARKTRLMLAFTDAYERTVEGQALDINCRGDANWTLDDYMRMVVLKTGRYLALGMVGGAIIAGAGDAVVDAIYSMGETLGPAFQIRDDVIDLTEGKGRGGEIGCDIKEGKPSALYAHAMSHGSPEQRRALMDIMAKPREATTDDDVARAIGIYEDMGAMAFAERKAEELIHESYVTIDTLPLGSKELFRDIADFIAKRTT